MYAMLDGWDAWLVIFPPCLLGWVCSLAVIACVEVAGNWLAQLRAARDLISGAFL